METLTLYRGDFEEIDQFMVSKTNRFCYVGPGIYLTNRRSIAETYRVKGSKGSATLSEITLFKGEAKSREQALEFAFPSYVMLALGENPMYVSGKAETAALSKVTPLQAFGRAYPKLPDGRLRDLRRQFVEAYDDKTICAEYTLAGVRPSFFRSLRGNAELKVTLKTGEPPVGHLSKFVVPKLAFEGSVINVADCIRDQTFWEIVWNEGLNIGEKHSNIHTHVYANTRLRPRTLSVTPYRLRKSKVNRNLSKSANSTNFKAPVGGYDVADIVRARLTFQRWGYLGLEYTGGVATGGIRHRAFCIWDEDFVNQHRVPMSRE